MKDVLITNIDELREVLSKITVKNTSLNFNWRFEVNANGCPTYSGWFVNIAFDRVDRITNTIQTGRSRMEHIAPNTTLSGVVKTGWLLMELTIRHELMEAFHYDGCRLFDPHNTVAQLCGIRKKK